MFAGEPGDDSLVIPESGVGLESERFDAAFLGGNIALASRRRLPQASPGPENDQRCDGSEEPTRWRAIGIRGRRGVRQGQHLLHEMTPFLRQPAVRLSVRPRIRRVLKTMTRQQAVNLSYQARTDAIVADSLFGATALLVVAGAVLYFVDARTSATTTNAR
jgi:hypothetical protein